MRMLELASGVLLIGLVSSSAHAHISLERGGTQKSRYGDANIKAGPCGVAGGARGTNIYTYEPGSTITVKLVEYVPHPGYFRFAFDQDGDDDFKDPASIVPLDPARGCPATGLSPALASRDECMQSDFYNTPAVLPEMDNLDPHVTTEANKLWTFQVTLPNIECDNCTLQVIQVMEDPVHGPYNLQVAASGDADDVYHQCVDLVLKQGASAADGGVAGSAGALAANGGNAAPVHQGTTTSSGCSVLASGSWGERHQAPCLAFGAIGALAFRRGRVRRSRTTPRPPAIALGSP
jgi:hypothetical protein